MKRHMILLPVLLAVLLIVSAALYLHKPSFTFTLEKASGDMQQVEGLEYTMTVADASMRWELSGKGKDISYTTSFLKEQEELAMEYDSLNEGFYLYIPTLLDGKQLTDYELEISRTITDDRYEEPVKADFYNIKQVAVDLLVKTDKGYACFPSGLKRRFQTPRSNIVYHQKDQQLYFQSNPEKAGLQKGGGLRHPYVTVQGKTLVPLYVAGNGSSGQYRIYEVEKALQSESMPNVQEAKKASKVKQFISFDAKVNGISDVISYHDQLYAAVLRDNQGWLEVYDASGKLVKEEKLPKNTVFHRFDIQDGRLLILTSQRDKSYLKVYEQDKLVMDITSPISLSDSKFKLQDGRLFALNLRQPENKAQHFLEISVFDQSKMVFDGYVKGDFEEDEKASAFYKKLRDKTNQTIPAMPYVNVRDVYAYGFKD